ncbi:GTPase HflX [Novosphingobium resinovorum]|uniref:GTPase HflX n=1 Tax=Sphingomonadaceae TaxID=41297 RepID=UPI00027C9B38|nr:MULTISPECIES: GTPase HflX [Sphingomonadaceae]EJU14105.1 GTP-binding protein HflX [Sphingomonas sp. LH128]MBF7011432.1 GTPase HflX [Novosphingobium sp. HR1a]WJM29410.1 GTPase HflX [Novosphingobium resinovorum]
MNDELKGEVTRGARALVVYPQMRGPRGERNDLDPEARLEEARGLALAIGLEVVEAMAIVIREARPGTLFGEGQIQNISTACTLNEAELIIVDGSLSAIQQRNLEEKLKRKVIDRTGLILEIFGERAATAEGRLQVELAHLDYQAGRLVRSWTHLERQRGGFGFLGGPGETQIEADRRMIRDRMAKIRRELEQVRRTRGLHRDRREKAPWPVVALVGYTNAGKSTLFNRLTGASVMAENLLFATLDPTMRAIRMPGLEKAILSDTVGFISDLPTELIAAFRATLEEVTAADVILHVRDIANPDTEAQKRQVLDVLADLGVIQPPLDDRKARQAPALDWSDDEPDDEPEPQVPIIEVWNKWDLLDPDQAHELREVAMHREGEVIVPVSALTGEGCDALLDIASRNLTRDSRIYSFVLPVADGQRFAFLHARGEVVSEEDAGEGEQGPQMRLEVRLSEREFGRFKAL